MAKSFKILTAQLPRAVQKRANIKTNKMLLNMHLQELRKVRQESQTKLAQKLHIKQAAISKLERRTDMYISTLRSYVEGLGGKLEITARFPDMDVKIDQFSKIGKGGFKPLSQS